MERLDMTEVTAVSRYWTPDHLDVTNVPATYARPKATWIEGFERLKPLVPIDAQDRMVRRRMQTRAVVDPAEITVLPPVVVQPDSVPVQRERVSFAGFGDLLRRWTAQPQ
jgi:hypothetical protein